jgi:hypothetical protein
VAHPLKPAQPGRRAWLICLLVVLLLHMVVLTFMHRALQPPSLLARMAPPMYTRTIQPVAPVAVAQADVPAAPPVATNRPTAQIRSKPLQQPARKPAQRRAQAHGDGMGDASTAAAPFPRASDVADAVSAPPMHTASDSASSEPLTAAASAPEESASTPVADHAPAKSADPTAAASMAIAAASAPSSTASSPRAAFLASWPGDTRLNYRLGGNYRGELHGDGRVLWQRVGTRYQASVELSAGLLGSLTFSSQGEITQLGLHPEVYEENLRGRRRGVRLGEDIQLQRGQRVPRPAAVQDTASQFVELGHRFATGQIELAPGTQVRFTLARPGGVDDWIYDVVGLEKLHLPQLGEVDAWHLKPRRLDKPRGPYSAEIWFAPTLQYLPVRIRLTQSEDTYVELTVDTIEQQ